MRLALLILCSLASLLKAEAAPRRLQDPLPAGLAVWAQGSAKRLAPPINRHNTAVGQSQRIVYIFHPCGEVLFERAGARLVWDPAPAQELAERLGGDTRVLPWLRLRGRGGKDAHAVASELALALRRDRRLAGLYLEGPSAQTALLLAALRPLTDKPLMAQVDPQEAEAWPLVDVAVLQPTKQGLRARVRAGLKMSAEQGRKMLVGLPADGAGLEKSLEQLKTVVAFDNEAYLGGALCCLNEGPYVEIDGPPAAAFAPEVWKRLALPLVNP